MTNNYLHQSNSGVLGPGGLINASRMASRGNKGQFTHSLYVGGQANFSTLTRDCRYAHPHGTLCGNNNNNVFANAFKDVNAYQRVSQDSSPGHRSNNHRSSSYYGTA